MKVQIKDLKPNPFRDIDNYPINEDKVQSLTNSINQTGFWDNILARPKPGHTEWTEPIDGGDEHDEACYLQVIRNKNGEIEDYDDPIFEIAYGHHRLVILRKLFKPDDYVDIPIRELDDPTMIRIMANENDESWGTNPKIINETIRVTKIFLENHPEIVKNLVIPIIHAGRSTSATMISEFLGGNWNYIRVFYTLERLRLIEKGELNKEAIELLPTEKAARDFVKATKQIKNITPEQQREAAKSIIKNQSFGESTVKSALLEEKYRDKKTKEEKEEHDFIEFKDFISECTKDMKRLNEKLEQLFILKTKLKFDFGMYRNSTEAKDFDCETRILIDCLKKLLGKEGQNVKDKLLQIGD